MKILVTGASGFIGRNLIQELKNLGYQTIFEVDIETDLRKLEQYVCECEFIFHLAGVNRPLNEQDFIKGNVDFTSELLNQLKKNKNKSPILITSSTQAVLDNPYGKSKLASERLIFNYAKETNTKVFVYRLPNVFGKWCRPNYNSAVATFCNNIANDLAIQVNDPGVLMNLVYIDDVVDSFIKSMNGSKTSNNDHYSVDEVYQIRLGEIVDLLYSFKKSRENNFVPELSDSFVKKLYSTYLSYLPNDKFSYPLKMNIDERGSFTEFLKTPDRGQVSINISKPGITKGNHWHHTKNEKFLVISGEAIIRFRKIHNDKIIEYKVSGEKLEVVDIPVGYTHNIENIGTTDLVTVMWANELFDPEHPDTYFLNV